MAQMRIDLNDATLAKLQARAQAAGLTLRGYIMQQIVAGLEGARVVEVEDETYVVRPTVEFGPHQMEVKEPPKRAWKKPSGDEGKDGGQA